MVRAPRFTKRGLILAAIFEDQGTLKVPHMWVLLSNLINKRPLMSLR